MQRADLGGMAGLASHIYLAVAYHGIIVCAGGPDQHVVAAKRRYVRCIFIWMQSPYVRAMAGDTLIRRGIAFCQAD